MICLCSIPEASGLLTVVNWYLFPPKNRTQTSGSLINRTYYDILNIIRFKLCGSAIECYSMVIKKIGTCKYESMRVCKYASMQV